MSKVGFNNHSIYIHTEKPGESVNAVRVTLQCPECKKMRSIWIAREFFTNQEFSRLYHILIPRSITCDHIYTAFLDKNGDIRGYQKTDLELSIVEKIFPKQEIITESLIQQKGTFNILMGTLKELMFKTLRAILTNVDIYCISSSLNSEYKKFFEDIFLDRLNSKIIIISKEVFDDEVRHVLKNMDKVFIFNENLGVVMKEPPYFHKFNEDCVEKVIFNTVNSEMVDNFIIIKTLQKNLEILFSLTDELYQRIEKKEYISKGQVKKLLKNSTLKLAYTDSFRNIMKNRYNIDLTEFFRDKILEIL
ncbi:MAG: hypothetical protein BAJALOKI1v1_40034 [Promethearchaeota archaeon]|nr:MAG: hypothetical protein BAJALOKI1v1_40034 [Candidatus Lokiarchaeota archaeon]